MLGGMRAMRAPHRGLGGGLHRAGGDARPRLHRRDLDSRVPQRASPAGAASPGGSNALSVRVEVQADCFAGVWAHSTYERKLLEAGDIDEALHAAQVVGDDYLARARGSAVDPDSWTHGSSAQRKQWFTTGCQDGRPDACDTFAGQ
jgi:predicted metalloprotease